MAATVAARDEFLARRRITEARRRLAGPLLSAAVDADRHLRMMLAYGDDSNYIRSHFKDKPEVVVMSAIYELSRFIHYRWLLHIKMKDENVEYTDSWLFAVERVFLGLSLAAGSKDIKVSEYTKKWQWLPQAGQKIPVKHFVSCPIVREALTLHHRRQYPMNFLLHERNAIGELMVRQAFASSTADSLPQCLNYTEFVAELKCALQSSQSDAQHPWVAYFVPLWKDMVRLISLEMQCMDHPNKMHALDFMELMQFRVRMRAFQLAIHDIIEVFSFPLDAWNSSPHLPSPAKPSRKSVSAVIDMRRIRAGQDQD
eukprot:jgi/Tetstr1/465287/TSEL_009988.t1